MEIDPSHAALLLIHWQNDIVKPDGAFGSFFAQPVEQRGLLETVPRVAEGLRDAGVPVIYVRVCYRQGYPDLIVNNAFFAGIQANNALLEGSWGAGIVDELAPREEDIVVPSRRVTGFPGTDLDVVLRASGVQTVLISGVATNISVLGTALEAVNAGYQALVLEDCCAAATDEMHQVAIATLGLVAGVTSSADILGTLG